MQQDDSTIRARDLLEDYQLLGRDIGLPCVTPPRAVIRGILAPILRKWLFEGEIFRIQKDLGKRMTFKVYRHKKAIECCKAGTFNAWVGMVPMGRIMTSYATPFHGGRPPDIREANKVDYDAKSFVCQKMAYANSKFATRKGCIAYVANRMGGTHPQKMEKIRDHELYGHIYQWGFCLSENGQMQMMHVESFKDALDSGANEERIYNAMHLIVLDTAQRFHDAIGRSKEEISRLCR